MVVVATQAMAAVAKDSKHILDFGESEADPVMQGKMDAAVSKRDVRLAVAEVFPLLVSSLGKDNQSLKEKYFPDEIQLAQAQLERSDDFTQNINGGYAGESIGCYANCHSACHSACHGSRSWR